MTTEPDTKTDARYGITLYRFAADDGTTRWCTIPDRDDQED